MFVLSVLGGREKKFKNGKNCKFGINKIKYLQRSFLRNGDFFSRPASPL